MKIKISQIAIAVPDVFSATYEMERTLGFKFYFDDLQMDGFFPKGSSSGLTKNVQLSLGFNHDIMDGVELEYISSNSFKHWHFEKIRKNGNAPFLSHLGVYCENEEEYNSIKEIMKEKLINILQETESKNHSNFRVGDEKVSSRKYRDCIFDTEDRFGFNLKLSLKV